MIKSFGCKRTASVFLGKSPKGFPSDILGVARRKLRMLDTSSRLNDLRAPPSNHLEALKGNRAGQYSIRINDQWRICFLWQEDHAHDVQIVDYH